EDSVAEGHDLVDPNPGPDAAVAFTDQLEALLTGLDEQEQQIIGLKLQDLNNDDVALRLDLSERTVRRVLKRLEERCKAIADGGRAMPPDSSLPTVEDGCCLRFEEAWRRGQPLAIEDCLPPPDSPLYLATLEELVVRDMDFRARRRAAGGRAMVEDY